jgi:hypothetical protein
MPNYDALVKRLRAEDVFTRSITSIRYRDRLPTTRTEAADAIEKLQRDIDSLKDDIEAHIRIASEEATRAASLEPDAKRYRWLQGRVFADQGRRGRAYFVLSLPLPLGNPFKGSVAQHFDESVDDAIERKQER